ncbi:sialate O-acetylesterase [Mucilaginibacter sp. HMF5004]|uniref:sialate O-acetylesterase n=1 Tax=Mucilaginibacter rivuli TaxID=2857527 RepID=UPI001C5D492C|nr:sialate O-acetylesterase [Mucilaginibacter rivuli]MBW4891501.1 sialate O-acetylesterase [Mucilaginibacter rivuli]
MYKKLNVFIALLCFVFLSNYGNAQIRLPKIIADNMVLQRNQPVPVWGWVRPAQQVKINFSGQTKTAVANSEGYWKIMLNPMPANDKDQQMIITSDTSKIILKNILIGEVWFCSGQSNMEYSMKLMKGYTKPGKGIDSAELELSVVNPNIRLFKVEKVYSLPDVTTKSWNISAGTALEEFSAVGYYFAKNVYAKLHIPIGMIEASWGGSRIEPWTPPYGYAASAAFKAESTLDPMVVDSSAVGKMYKSMVHPIAPYALHGFLWYQGESNCMINEKENRYVDKMQALIDSWRKEFEAPKASFYSVLIAPYYYTKRKDHVPHTTETLPEFWEQQIESTKIPYSDIVSVTDLVDNFSNIHPSYKWEVGRRMALVALAKDYNYKNVVYSGPRYQKIEIKDGKAILYFNNATGLKSSDGQALNYFSVAGADGNYMNADAKIEGNTVVVSCLLVPKPKNVRFAWTETATPNLVNAAGLPAFPFRTSKK